MHENARHGIGGNNPPEPDDIQSPILPLPAARKYLGGIGMSTLYEKMSRGELEVCKLGGRSFVTRRSCDVLIAQNTQPPKTGAKAKPRHQLRPLKRRLTPGKQRRKRDDQRTARAVTVQKIEKLAWSRSGRPVAPNDRKVLVAVLRKARAQGRIQERPSPTKAAKPSP